MEGTITKHLLENWPSAIWLIVGGVIVWLFLSVKNIANKAKEASEIESQRTAHGNLDVSFRKIALDLEYLNKSGSDMSDTLAGIAMKSGTKVKSPKPATQTQSPITLTDRGRDLVAELGINTMINDNWMSISSVIEEQATRKNPYDIAKTCMDEILLFPEKFLAEEELNILKLRAYQDGDLLQSFLRIVAVLVRDRFFDEHHISIAEIDKHAPVGGEGLARNTKN